MYTLVSAPVLGFDLVRRTGGPAAAGVLLTALRLGAGQLPELAAAHVEDDARTGAWLELGRDSDDGAYASLSDTLATLTLRGSGAVHARRRLERSAIGSLGALVRFVRNEVFDWTWRGPIDGEIAVQTDVATRAIAVTCDAVAAAYAEHQLGAAATHRLAQPWREVAARLSLPALDLGPQTARILDFLDGVRTLDAAALARLRTPFTSGGSTSSAGGRPEAVGNWASLVHEASWAAHLSGRTRTAALAQMLAVQALGQAGVTPADAATGTWNAVSGAVHALVVADVLGDDDLSALLGPLAELLPS